MSYLKMQSKTMMHVLAALPLLAALAAAQACNTGLIAASSGCSTTLSPIDSVYGGGTYFDGNWKLQVTLPGFSSTCPSTAPGSAWEQLARRKQHLQIGMDHTRRGR